MSRDRSAAWTLVAALSCGALGLAHAAAPPLRYDTTTLAGVVIDKRTGLAWQASPGAERLTWSAAQTYCAQLALAGGGFRVPAYKELMTLVDPTQSAPAIDPRAFPGTPAEEFWSSTRIVRDPTYAWSVQFDAGSSRASAMAQTYRVRCVR